MTYNFTPDKSQETCFAVAKGLASGKAIAEIAASVGIDLVNAARYAARRDVIEESARIRAAK